MSNANVTLAQFRIFLEAVEAGSFTKAAKNLWMTQSAVSQAISSLESELGTPLVERDRRGISPTAVGQRVLVHVREILARTEQIRQETAATAGLEIGELHIGSFPSAATKLLPDVIRSFERRYPGIETALFEGTYHEVRDWVRDRTIDVGLVPLPMEGLKTYPLAADEMLVAVPEGHHSGDAPVVRLEEIAEDPFIMPKSGCEMLVAGIFGSAGITPRVRFEATDQATRLSMVRAGLGITMVAELALPPVPEGVKIARLEPPVWRHLALAVYSAETTSLAAKAFIRVAQDWLPTQSAPDARACVDPDQHAEASVRKPSVASVR
jgi:DNA-binding transcriptional LysR family regulator